MLKKTTLILVAMIFTVAALLWALSISGHAENEDAAGRPQFSHATLTVTRADGKVFTFATEVAQNTAEQTYGLMFVRHLASDAGMIFPYDPPQQTAFWMKNTYIPLDMLFISPDHSIGRIVTNARPLDVTPIPSLIEVSAVIEINGGTVDRDSLAVGDKVDSSALPRL